MISFIFEEFNKDDYKKYKQDVRAAVEEHNTRRQQKKDLDEIIDTAKRKNPDFEKSDKYQELVKRRDSLKADIDPKVAPKILSQTPPNDDKPGFIRTIAKAHWDHPAVPLIGGAIAAGIGAKLYYDKKKRENQYGIGG